LALDFQGQFRRNLIYRSVKQTQNAQTKVRPKRVRAAFRHQNGVNALGNVRNALDYLPWRGG
jgi:hypothetical protein